MTREIEQRKQTSMSCTIRERSIGEQLSPLTELCVSCTEKETTTSKYGTTSRNSKAYSASSGPCSISFSRSSPISCDALIMYHAMRCVLFSKNKLLRKVARSMPLPIRRRLLLQTCFWLVYNYFQCAICSSLTFSKVVNKRQYVLCFFFSEKQAAPKGRTKRKAAAKSKKAAGAAAGAGGGKKKNKATSPPPSIEVDSDEESDGACACMCGYMS